MPLPSKPLPPLSAKDIENFWRKVDVRGPDECWPWRKRKRKRVTVRSPLRRYEQAPIFAISRSELRTKQQPCRRSMVASRVAYFLFYGKDPHPLLVCHHCDNPPCCNGRHLFSGSQEDNIADRHNKGRDARGPDSGAFGQDRSGEKNQNSKLDSSDVEAIRTLFAAGGLTYRDIAESFADRFKITPECIGMIIRRQTWK